MSQSVLSARARIPISPLARSFALALNLPLDISIATLDISWIGRDTRFVLSATSRITIGVMETIVQVKTLLSWLNAD